MNEGLIYLIIYMLIAIFTLIHIVKTVLRELDEVRRKLSERGLSLRDAFFRSKPYDFWPERPISLKIAMERGIVFSLFIFSFTGIVGTIMLSLNLTPLENPHQIFYAAVTVALIFLPLLILGNYVYQLSLKKFGEPLRKNDISE
ncbi:MAG: hypothetical protein Q6351_001485 [Candidatus Njordarchaeum guaymaensis]